MAHQDFYEITHLVSPMILKSKFYLSNLLIQFIIGILNSRLSMSKKELLPCISILSALKVMKAIFF